MTLAEVLAQDVPERIRTKGNRYFLGGAVRAIEGSDTHVAATVRGSQWYRVTLRREARAIVGSCQCPYFSDRGEACKHLWAVILAADASGFLIGPTPLAEDTYLEFEYEHLAEGESGHVSSHGGPPSPPEPWRRLLAAVRDQALRRAPAVRSRFATGEMLYVLDQAGSTMSGAPAIQLQWRVRKKNGEWARPQPAAITREEIDQLPDDSDRQILALLLGASDSSGFVESYSSLYARASFRLLGPLTERVLPLVAMSGRLYLRPSARDRGPRSPRDLQPLAWDDGSPWSFRLDVGIIDGGQIRLDGALVRGHETMRLHAPDLVFAAGFLVAHERVGRLDHGGTFEWLAELRRSGPAVVPRDAEQPLIETLARSGVDATRLPEILRYETVVAAPRPRIRFARSTGPRGAREELEAQLQFEYSGTIVSATNDITSYDAERRRLVRRDASAEHACQQKLPRLGFHRPWYFEPRQGAFAIAVERFPHAVRALVEAGWHVEAEGRVFRAPRALDVQVKSGIDWFELHGRVDFGDGRSASIAELLAALRRGEATVLLDDGTRGLVPEEWLRRYARIAAFGEATGDHVRYRTSQTALLDALLEGQPAVHVDEAFARAREQLAQFSGVHPIDPPTSFQGRLRDYQRDALGWFAFLRRFGYGGCLADDMGLGKTVMVLALLESRRLEGDRRPSLAVVPRSLVFNWIEEAARFAPDLRVLDYTGSARGSARLEDFDLVLTTYATLRLEIGRLAECEFDYVILDEAQAIKNASTASTKAARLLRGRNRLALSGTPIENHLGELWSLFEFLNPGFLGPAGAFDRAIASTSTEDPPHSRRRAPGAIPTSRTRSDRERPDLTLVARALRPFILRRTKEQVAPELPAKVEQTIHCELDASERRFYDELRAHYREKLVAAVAKKGLNRSKIQVLEALLRLRQAATHAGLVDARRSGQSSAKFDTLLARLREVADEGHKALVFSQFTTLLGLLRPHLERESIPYEYLDGRTRDRAERVGHFEADAACRVFLISLKAGGLGLNLTAADYVFLLDPWWNPAVEVQAIDRAYRIGQTKHVFAYRLIARDTVEEKIAELQRSKRDLAEALFAEQAGLMKMLQPEDLEWLLS